LYYSLTARYQISQWKKALSKSLNWIGPPRSDYINEAIEANISEFPSGVTTFSTSNFALGFAFGAIFVGIANLAFKYFLRK
jgi:hypothetical protein